MHIRFERQMQTAERRVDPATRRGDTVHVPFGRLVVGQPLELVVEQRFHRALVDAQHKAQQRSTGVAQFAPRLLVGDVGQWLQRGVGRAPAELRAQLLDLVAQLVELVDLDVLPFVGGFVDVRQAVRSEVVLRGIVLLLN